MTRIFLGIATIFTLIGLIAGCNVVHPGDVGVVFNRVSGGLRSEFQGLVLVFPFVSTMQPYPISLRTYTMVARSGEGSAENDDSIDLPSKEGQHIRQDISITYNTTPERAADVFKSFNGADIEDIEKTFIRRTAITVAQTVAGTMSLTELISTKRDELQSAIETKLGEELTRRGFTLDKVNLGAAHLPESVEAQMQAKMAAQQDAQRAEYELVKQQTLAKARVAEAEGIAKANQTVQTSLTPAVLEKMKLEKWNGVLPTVQAGASNLMFNVK